MATKIRRCLFIGLGGTGMITILHAKRMFFDTYGEVPPMIGFLGIDTDNGMFKKTLSLGDSIISLDPVEQLPILVTDAKPIYHVNQECFPWLSDRNMGGLTSMTLGAGQIRSNGRFAFTVNLPEIESKVKSIIDKITNAEFTNNPKYEILSSEVEIHMVFSLGGGTGCGTFLNMAYLLRKVVPRCKLVGYGVLPDVFEAMSNAGMSKVKPNAFGAIHDLDFLMHLKMTDDTIKINYLKSIYETNDRPFNTMYLVDNKNNNNDTYTHIDQIAEMISLALITATGELSTVAASVSDNVEKNIREGSMNIENKTSWAAGFGICEILFQGQELRKIFCNKTVRRIIERLITNCTDATIIANNWIDTLQIRENNHRDDVIDFVLSKESQYPFNAINEPSNPKPECDMYLNSLAIPKQAEIDKSIDDLKTKVLPSLRNLIKERINKECGVAEAREIIIAIQAQIDICLTEMEHERKGFVINEPSATNSLNVAVDDLIREMGKRFFKKPQPYIDSVIDATNNLAIIKRETLRRSNAILFYNWLKQELLTFYEKVSNIEKTLIKITKNCSTNIAEIQYRLNEPTQTFQIDLANNFINNVTYDDAEILFNDITNNITLANQVFDFDTLSSEEITSILYNIVDDFRSAKYWTELTIDDILATKLTSEELAQIIKTAINKSEPLFRYDYKGYTPEEKPMDSYYIGVCRKENSVLYKGSLFKNTLLGNANVDFASLGFKNRIIIYRQIGVVPAYSLVPISSYEEKHEKSNAFCFWDVQMKRRMDSEQFSLSPRQYIDDSLELWVKGIIFGLIKKSEANNKYCFKSRELGDRLLDNWVMLSEHRDYSFDNFKSQKNIIREEFNKYFEELYIKNGNDYIQKIVDDAKLTYFEKFSQIGIRKEDLLLRGNESVRKLITAELNYIDNL